MGNTSVKPHPRSRHKKQVHWKAADRPSPPGKPQLVSESEITPDVVTIRWDPPRYDGGSPITGYLVEHRRYGSPHWVRATPLLVPFTELSLSGLEPGWRYQFRISAENAVGLSISSELSELLTVTLQRSAVTAPRFIDELKDAVALENEKVEFIAQFLGQPAPKICWFKDGFEIFSSRRIRIITENDKSVLTIHQSALGDEGEIKCTATNRAGHASTKAMLTLEAPPSIRLPRQYEDGLLFELGEVVRLKVSIAGRPSPLVFWTHNNETMTDDRYEIDTTDKYSSIRLEEAKRTDRGEYQIKAVNKLGEAVSSFLVTVTDKPAPPGHARVVMTLGRSVTLSWGLPIDDGGCKIGNYIVEYFRLGWDVWLKAATCRQLTTTIGDLIEGSEYKFRIKAESPYGVSDPSIETDVVFIPDPKRGILTPSARSRSQPRDIFADDATSTKRPPRSLSSTRTETIPKRPTTPVHFYEGGIPVRPARTKIKSPSITPEPSPLPSRRNVTAKAIDRDIFDRSSMSRDLSYGTPEIQLNKMENNPMDIALSTPYNSDKLNQLPNVAVKSTVNVIHHQNTNSVLPSDLKRRTSNSPVQKPPQSNFISSFTETKMNHTPKSPSPKPKISSPKPKSPTVIHHRRSPSPQPESKRRSPSPVRFIERARAKSPSPTPFTKSRSPSPIRNMKHEAVNPKYNLNLPKTPRDKDDPLSESSEFMLVLLPDNQTGRGSASDLKFDFDEHCIPPPMSLSAPELGADLLLFEPLRNAVSSTELLHEHAMERFYEALAAEEEEERERDASTDVPKIQINSKDDQIIVGLERRNSLRRRLSAGGLTIPQQILWAQRRHSLRNTPDLTELPENSLRKHPIVLDSKNSPINELTDISEDNLPTFTKSVNDKRELFSTRQRSESEEREEEEFQKVRAKMADKKKEQRKNVEVVKEEDWDEVADDEEREYEESLSESETESSEDERLSAIEIPPLRAQDEEEIYHPNLMNRKIVNQSKSKSDAPFEILTKPNPLPDPNFIPKPILKRRDLEEIPEKPIRKSINTNNTRQRSLSMYPQNSTATTNLKEAEYDLENSSRQRSFSLFPQNKQVEATREAPTMRKRGLSPIAPYRNVSAALTQMSGMTAASIAMPKPAAQPAKPKKSEEEIKVVVDHYGDIVRSYGQKRRTIPKVYLNAEDLKAAAERQSREDLREIDRSMENLSSPEEFNEETLDLPTDSGSRRRSFVIEASSALFRSVKERVSAAFADEEEDDIIPPDAEISPSMQRRGSGQLNLRRTSKTPTKAEKAKAAKKGAPAKSESNWSNLRTPSPGPQGRKTSPSPMRRTSLIPPTTQARRTSLTGSSPIMAAKPKMRETTTQTAGYEDSPGDPKKNVLLAAKQEELSAKAEFKVRTTVDYITDLAMFAVACWLYLFQNELLAIPVLLVMVYRQLKEEIKKKMPGWMVGKKKVKRK